MKLNSEKLNKTLRERAAYDLEEGRISCADIIVRQDGEEVARLCTGFNNVLTGEPLKENSMFRLASMTKPVTGIATMIAMQNGWFDLDDKLEDHLPQFADMMVARETEDGYAIDHPADKSLRLWHLLTHVNGIMPETELGYRIYDRMPKASYQSLEAVTDACAASPLAFDPETMSSYSGYCAFDVMARLIEIKSGMPYSQFVQKNIFDPLGITDMTFHPTEEQWRRLTTVHTRLEGRVMAPQDLGRHLYDSFPMTYECGGAGLCGSLAAYDRFAQMLLGGGTLDGVEIVGREAFAEFVRPRVGADTPGRDPGYAWGMGVRVIENDKKLHAGSFGWSGAYGTHFWVDPVNRITAIYLRANPSYPDRGFLDVKRTFEADVMNCLE